MCVCVCGEIEFWHASTLEIIPIIFSDISSIQASSVKWNRHQKFRHWIYWWECGTDASRPRWRTFQLVRNMPLKNRTGSHLYWGPVMDRILHSGPENLKKPWTKKLWNQISQFHEKKLLTKFQFLPFQKWPKINFWTGETV